MTALSLQTYVGGPAGMSRKAPQHEIDDVELWSAYDVNLEDPGFLKRRGPLTATSATGAGRTTRYGIGLARCQSPDGLEQMLALVGKSGSAASEVYGFGANTSNLNSGGSTMAWPYDVGHSPYEHFCSNASAGKGVWIGTANKYDKPTNQALALWRGASKDDATALAVSAVARGDLTITVTSAIASCAPGHHVFDGTGYYIGVIKSIASNVITLENKAVAAAATTIDVRVLRGGRPRVSTGRISTHTETADDQVNGGSTKFKQEGLNSGTWDIFKTDYTYIGTVKTVNSDVQLLLDGHASVACSNEDYIAIKRDTYAAGYALQSGTLGWINASFGGHQFFAGTGVNGNELLFSDDTDPEAVDVSVNGNSIIFSEDPIRALIPTSNALVVVTENEAYALTGAIGTTPDQWRGERILDDGTICGMSALSYKGGAIWAGKRGVWFWDSAGSGSINVVGHLDDDYRKFVAGFSSASNRAYGMIVRDHYLCFMDGGASSIFTYTKGSTTTSVTRPTFDVQLTTGAVAIHRNVELRGSIAPPEFLGLGTNLFLVTTTVPDARVLQGDVLYTTETGTDAYACNGSATTNADFYIETKKYDQGDGQRLKLHRMLLLHFCTTAGNIKFDTVVGLNTTGVTSQTEYNTSTSFVDKRIKFNARSQYLSFRLYQSETDGTGQEHSAVSVTCTSASPMVVTKTTHGMVVGMKVIFGGTAAPTGITAGTTYYVSEVPTADTFKVSATYGGANVNSSSTGTAVTATYGNAAVLTRLKLGGWAIGFKWKRPGRV